MWTGYVTTDGRIETFWFNTKNGRRAIGFLERKAKANGDFVHDRREHRRLQRQTGRELPHLYIQ